MEATRLSAVRSRQALRTAVRQGRATHSSHGIYVLAPPAVGIDHWWQSLLAAVTAHPRGALDGQVAAALYGLDGFELGAPITVQLPPGTSGRRAEARRRTILLEPGLVGTPVGLVPVCAPGEVLLGLGAGLSPRPGCAAARTPLDPAELVELALEAALRQGLTTIEELESLVRRATANRPGRGVLIEVLRTRPPGAKPTGSYLETRCAQVLRHANIPAFERQVELTDADGRIGFVDFNHHNIVIECVGKAFHLDRFNPDHKRYARITATGHQLLPYTFNDIEYDPNHVINTTKSALNHGERSVPLLRSRGTG